MQRYDVNLPLLNGLYMTENMHVCEERGQLRFDDCFESISYEAAAAGLVSYLPTERMFVLPFMIRTPEKIGHCYALYDSMAAPQNALIKPRHWARQRQLSRVTSADAALMLCMTAAHNDDAWHSRAPDERVKLMLGKLSNAGFNRYIVATVNGLADLDDDADEEEADELIENQRQHVLFYDNSVVHLTPSGPFLPMGLSNRGEVAKNDPASVRKATIYVGNWLGVTEMGHHMM